MKSSNGQEALEAYNLIGEESKHELDNITELAAAICNTPVAKINLLNDNSQLTISDFGSDKVSRAIPRNMSICQHTIQQQSILEVPDLSKDPRFKDKHYVNQEPHYKYYLGAPLINLEGQTIGALCVLDYSERNISDNKKRDLQILADQVMTSLELRKQNQRLIELNEQKNNLMKVLSHDLRSPLSGIIGMSDLLKELVANDNEEALEMASLVNQSAKQLNQLIDDILNYTIIESQGFSLHLTDTDVSSIVEKMKRLYMPSAKLKNIDLVFETDVDRNIQLDDEKFEQIFGNLLSNAIKFTKKDGEINGRVFIEDDNLVLRVRDTGVGMKEEVVKNLFNKNSSKGQKGTSGEKSTGLGLSIIKHFTDLHNGTIDVESTLGEGTTFTIHFPLYNG